MKKISFAILLILVFYSVATAAIKDSPDGFRDIKWGDPPSALGQHTLIETKDEDGMTLSLYTRNADSMSIGKASLLKIIYTFFDNEFASVAILPEIMDEHYHELLMAFIAQYGTPSSDDKFSDNQRIYKWEDDDVLILYYLSYDASTELSSSFGIISSKRLIEKYEERNQKPVKKDF